VWNDEMMLGEVMKKFDVLPQNLSGGTEKNYETSHRACPQVDI
jgi:hypothetical protein